MASCLNDDESGTDESKLKTTVDETFYRSICRNVVKDARMCEPNEHIFVVIVLKSIY